MENNVVLYRKYRPRRFSEVVGQAHIVSAIGNAIKEGKVAHAYLFSGPRGIGKTTVARLIAKALNCVGKDRPCDSCDSCTLFNEGRAFDVIEIDAASNRGIDEIRELRDAVRFVPAEGKFKTYIVDEVHMLTKEAFNELLNHIGLVKHDINLDFNMIASINRKVLDKKANRYYFVAQPHKISIPNLGAKQATIPIHPEKKETRTLNITKNIFISEEDYKKIVTMRRMISVLNPDERTEILIDRLSKTTSNAEFLEGLAKDIK